MREELAALTEEKQLLEILHNLVKGFKRGQNPTPVWFFPPCCWKDTSENPSLGTPKRETTLYTPSLAFHFMCFGGNGYLYEASTNSASHSCRKSARNKFSPSRTFSLCCSQLQLTAAENQPASCCWPMEKIETKPEAGTSINEAEAWYKFLLSCTDEGPNMALETYAWLLSSGFWHPQQKAEHSLGKLTRLSRLQGTKVIRVDRCSHRCLVFTLETSPV